jgi:hypothetical protein
MDQLGNALPSGISFSKTLHGSVSLASKWRELYERRGWHKPFRDNPHFATLHLLNHAAPPTLKVTPRVTAFRVPKIEVIDLIAKFERHGIPVLSPNL